MSKVISEEAAIFLRNDPQVFASVCQELQIIPASLSNLINRRGRRLTEQPVLSLISKAMGKNPSELLTDTKLLQETSKQ
jgi:hypothetical protein